MTEHDSHKYRLLQVKLNVSILVLFIPVRMVATEPGCSLAAKVYHRMTQPAHTETAAR